jgi:hypothetical protein
MKTSSRVVVTVLVVATATFCGMFAPFAFAFRNAIWDPVFGVGFLVAGFVFHPFTGNRMVGLIGGGLWPLLVIAGIGFGAWMLTAARPSWRLAAVGLFALSVFLWVSVPTANRISRHGVPFYSSYCSVWY